MKDQILDKQDFKFNHAKITNDEILKYLKSLQCGKEVEIAKEADGIRSFLERKNILEVNRKTSFTFIDLFAGIGGVRLGFERAGGKCVMTSEIDKKAIATYFCNFGEIISEEFQDITKINENQIPKHDVLLGGFPCQAFSIAGERKGFNDARGTLFFDIQRIISAKKPKAFLLENVKGLLSHDNGDTMRVILDILENELKYKIFYKVLNTMNYGDVPQTRERIYLVGFDKKVFGHDVKFQFPEQIPLTKTIQDCLDGNNKDENLYYEKFEIYKDIKKQLIKENTIYQWRRIYVRENKSSVCPTLTANMGTGGHNVPLIKEKATGRIRKLSPRECANFQGFPESYYIPKFMANSHLYKQFGNSVSVPVVKRIAEKIEQIINQAKNKQ